MYGGPPMPVHHGQPAPAGPPPRDEELEAALRASEADYAVRTFTVWPR